MDRSTRPLWPRWVGYLNLWIALSGAGGGLAVFFKHGPFAWNGLVGFYIPIAAFTVWIAVMTYYMHVGISRQFDGDTTAPAAHDNPDTSATGALTALTGTSR
jgi:hypothetical protein